MKAKKEFDDIFIAIRKWTEKNDNNVAFIGSFISFDEEKIKKNADYIIKDDAFVAYGRKDVIEISLKSLNKMIKKEKEEFINL